MVEGWVLHVHGCAVVLCMPMLLQPRVLARGSLQTAARTAGGVLACKGTMQRPSTLALPSVAVLQELVCMEQRADLLAVGSMGHVQLLDPRRWASVHWVLT